MSLLKKMQSGTISERLPEKNEVPRAEKTCEEKKCGQPEAVCEICGDANFWANVAGTWRCARCFRPVESLCTAWLDVLAAAQATTLADAPRAPPGPRIDDPWAEVATPRQRSPLAVCRCGSTNVAETAIHGGASSRVDCAGCGRFLRWGRWNETTTE